MSPSGHRASVPSSTPVRRTISGHPVMVDAHRATPGRGASLKRPAQGEFFSGTSPSSASPRGGRSASPRPLPAEPMVGVGRLCSAAGSSGPDPPRMYIRPRHLRKRDSAPLGAHGVFMLVDCSPHRVDTADAWASRPSPSATPDPAVGCPAGVVRVCGGFRGGVHRPRRAGHRGTTARAGHTPSTGSPAASSAGSSRSSGRRGPRPSDPGKNWSTWRRMRWWDSCLAPGSSSAA